MTTPRAPTPLRVLIAWASPADDLRRALEALRPAVETTAVSPADASAYLAEADYYHILCLAPATWLALTPTLRKRFASHTNLILLGPEPSTSADLIEARAAVYLPESLSRAEAIAAITRLHYHLTRGWTLTQCVEASERRLALSGTDACWSDFQPTRPAVEPASAPDSPLARFANIVNGIAIGQVNVQGDVIQGTKVVHEVKGDQHFHGSVMVDKIEQNVEGDQVNVNRFVGTPTTVTQSAGGDQVNINRNSRDPTSNSDKACLACGTENEGGNEYCRECGSSLK